MMGKYGGTSGYIKKPSKSDTGKKELLIARIKRAVFHRNRSAEPVNRVGTAFYELSLPEREIIVAEQKRDNERRANDSRYVDTDLKKKEVRS